MIVSPTATVLLLVLLLLCPLTFAQAGTPPQPRRVGATQKLRLLPESFEPNAGQTDPAVRYLSRGAGHSILFQDHEVDFVLAKRESASRAGDPPNPVYRGLQPETDRISALDLLRMRLDGARADSELSGLDRLPGTVNYISGKDPARWHTQIPTFSKVQYRGVYPGINLVYYGNPNKLEFDFQVAPGASVSPIRLRFTGEKSLALDRSGNLNVVSTYGSISFHKPMIYQFASYDTRLQVEGGFRLFSNGSVGFSLGSYDRTRPLIIDPILDYSTYLGPLSAATAIAVDAAGESFVAGYANAGMPTTAGSYQPNFPAAGKHDPTPVGDAFFTNTAAFVAKLNSAGTALVYCTYLSGSENDAADAIAVDASGNAYIAGATASPDFPVTAGAFQTGSHVSNRGSTGFITELDASGSNLVYSTFLGGSTSASITGLALDAAGNAFVTGWTSDLDFPVTPGAFQTSSPVNPIMGGKGFISKLAAGGQKLLYSTYIGGTNWDLPYGIAIDAGGNAYIAGGTASSDFPTTPGAFQLVNKATVFNYLGGSFVSKLNPEGSALVYSTYLDGSYTDVAYAIAVDAGGNAYVTGFSVSGDFPTTPRVFQPVTTLTPLEQALGMSNVFITKLNPAGSGLAYSTFFGGNQTFNGGAYGTAGLSIAVDGNGNAYVAGSTGDIDFPVTPGALQTLNATQFVSADLASFVAKIDPTASKILYSTYLTGTGDQSGDQAGVSCDCATGIALDSSQNVYVAGRTISTDFPTTLGTIQNQSKYGASVFVTKFNSAEMQQLPLSTTTVTASPNPQTDGQQITFTATVKSTSGSTPKGTVGFSYQDLLVNGTPYALGPWNNVALDGSGTAEFTTASLPSGSIGVVAYYLGDANNSPSLGSMTETVNQIPTTTTITANPSAALYGTPITFMATVVETASGKPAQGSVLFLLGSTSFEFTALDSAGQTTWTSGALGEGGILPVGTQSITAEFTTLKGAPDHGSQGSVTVNVTQQGAADFTVSANPASLSANVGQSVTTTISVTPTNAFSQSVSFSCSGQPTGASCAFSPNNVNGRGATTLTISAPTTIASNRQPAITFLASTSALALLFGWIPFRHRRTRVADFLAGVLLIAFSGLCGCGGSNAGNSSPMSRSYQITVQATSGSLSHTATLNLTVTQP